jgi:hypothetical protein
VARRRYGKSPAISTAGQAAQPRDPAGDESLAQPIEPRQEYGKAEPASASEPAQHFSTGLGEQLRQHRQSAEEAQLHGYIDSIPTLSPAQRQWLHLNPSGIARFDLLNDAHIIATEHRKIPVDSPEYFHFLSAMLNAYGHLPPQQMAQPAPAPPMPPMPAPTHVDIEQSDSEPEEPMPTHFSAPVSRGSERGSIEPEPSLSSIRLTPQEREIARLSMPHLSVDEAEKTYAAGVLERDRKKRSGLIK